MINSVNSNPTALSGQRTLNSTQQAQERQIEQLASGKRVNRAADDPAASAIIEQFAAQIAGSNQAARNLNDGISLAQTAEGALSTVTDNTQRIRELAVQAGNSTLSSSDRAAIQGEVDALSQASNSTLRNANFNGQALFQGNQLSIQAGPSANPSDRISLSLGNLSASAADGGLNSSNGRIDLSSESSASSALEQIDADLNRLNEQRASLGALNSRFEASIANLQSGAENLSAARSRIADTDYAATASRLAQERIRNEAGLAVQTQANASPRQVLSLLRS